MGGAESYKVASIADSAMDVHAMGAGVTEYLRTRDPELVREVPGRKLTWFYLRPIPRSVFSRFVQTGATEDERFERAFKVAVVRVDGLSAELPSKVPTGSVESATGKIECWKDEELELISPAYVDEIGALAWWRSFLAHEKQVTYPQRRTSLAILATRALQSAAALQTAATQSGSENPSQGSSQDSEPQYDAPTAAAVPGTTT